MKNAKPKTVVFPSIRHKVAERSDNKPSSNRLQITTHHSRAITGKDHERDTQCFPVLSPPGTRSNRTISTNDESATVAPATADATTVPSAIPNQPADPIYFQVHFQVGQKTPSADHKTSRKGILQRKRCDQRGKIKQQGAIHFRPEEKARTGRSRFGGIQGELYRCACSLRLLAFYGIVTECAN